MERLHPRVTVAVPIFVLALTAGAAVSFGVGNGTGFISDATEDMFVMTWLLGWVLLVWAAILGGGHAVLLGMRLLSRRPVSRLEAALAAVSLVLIAVALATHPLWGTGSAVGGGAALR